MKDDMNTQNENTSTITPEMIGHYRQLLALRDERTDRLDDHAGFGNRVIALPYTDPFIIRFEQYSGSRVSAAYLSVVNGSAEWRYSQCDPGYLRCPLLHDPDTIRTLDGVFMMYYRKHCLPDVLSETRHLSGRLAWIDDWFFSDETEVDHSIIIGEDIVGELYCCDGAWDFLEYVRDRLGPDRCLFKVKWLKAGKHPERILSIRFDRQVSFVDVAMAGNLYLHLLLTLNELFWPNHEIRRYLNGNTGHGGILGILSVKEWHRLADIRGKDAVDRKFERITAQTVVDIPTDHQGRDILVYDKIAGL